MLHMKNISFNADTLTMDKGKNVRVLLRKGLSEKIWAFFVQSSSEKRVGTQRNCID